MRNMITKNKKYFLAILLLLINASTFAQTAAAETKTSARIPEWAFDPVLYLVGFVFFVMVLTIYVLYRVNIGLIKVISPKAVESISEKVKVAVAEKKPSLLRKAYLKMLDSVPVEKEKDVLLDHDYDGIKELDNNLPPWWKYGFYFTIVFAVCYLLYYHVSGVGKLQAEEYKDELLFAAQQKEARIKAGAENVNELNVLALKDADGLAKGKETFLKLCVACHRADGGGQVGPNLTDEFWIHGGGIKNVFKTITYGVPTKGMISWQSQLSPKQIQQVASFILTLKGTNPPGPKEPQGDIWVEEVTAVPDSINITKHDSTFASADTLKKK
jgi:cytochrome c oxidase cbb3-type subunit III